MTKILKLAGCALMMSSFCANEVKANCPELSQTELRRLCRWEGFKVFGIKAGSIEKDGVTLTNKLGTCGEGDSVKEFVTKKGSTMYPGILTKDFAEPTNPLKGLCTYTVGHDKIAFNVQLPPKPEEPKPLPEPQPHRKDPRTIGGVDITTSPHLKQVPIERPKIASPAVRQELPQVAATPDHPGRPVPSYLNPTPRPAVRGIPSGAQPAPQQEERKGPPQYAPPQVPSKVPQRQLPPTPTVEGSPIHEEKPTDMRSELEQQLKKRRMQPATDQDPNTPPRRRPPEPPYRGE